MKTIDPASLGAALKWRYATKRFDATRKIDPAHWSVLEEVLVLSPSSFGLQPWQFHVITSQPVKEALVPVSWGQRQLADASHVVVFTVKHPLTSADVRRHMERTAEVQATSLEQLAGFEKVVAGFVEKPAYPLDVREWSTRQLYIALGMFMQSAALLGIDTCPMEGIDPSGYDRVLGLEGSGYFTAVACPAGYRHAEDQHAGRAKVRYPAEHVIKRV